MTRFTPPDERKRKVVVHVLHCGRALCRFTDDLPMAWPKGHIWVRPSERALATCDSCLHALDKGDRNGR